APGVGDQRQHVANGAGFQPGRRRTRAPAPDAAADAPHFDQLRRAAIAGRGGEAYLRRRGDQRRSREAELEASRDHPVLLPDLREPQRMVARQLEDILAREAGEGIARTRRAPTTQVPTTT